MTLDQIKENPITATAAVNAAMEQNPEIHDFIMACLTRFFSGDYGTTGPEDTAANNAELADGAGRVVAHYEAFPGMEDDIFIIAVFNEDIPGDNNNNTCVLYCSEY